MRQASFKARNQADAERHLIACQALVDVLQDDPRVIRVYEDWRQKTGLATLTDRLRASHSPAARDAIQAELLLTFYGAGVAITSFILPAFVAKDLRLPYPWLALQLSATFQGRVIQDIAQDDARWSPLAVAVPTRRAPKGRRAKGGGDSIRRNVEWFYRAHLQEPPESVRALAREDSRTAPALGLTALTSHKRKSDARSIVQDGIARAKALLDMAEYVFTPLPK